MLDPDASQIKRMIRGLLHSDAIDTALSFKNGKMHASKEGENPLRDLNIVTKSQEMAINYAVAQSLAFGGHNAAVLLKKYNV